MNSLSILPSIDVEVLREVHCEACSGGRSPCGLHTEIVNSGVLHAKVLEVEAVCTHFHSIEYGGPHGLHAEIPSPVAKLLRLVLQCSQWRRPLHL